MRNGPWDAVVVGGGPAGLSAAFWLARYGRRTLLLDGGSPRNEAAWAVHGYPGVPDPRPDELRRRIREQAVAAGALLERGQVAAVSGEKGAFRVARSDGDPEDALRVLLAYGRTDRVPRIPGLEPLYGSSVFHCPDCDGPSVAGERVGVVGHDRPAAALALYLLNWTADVTLLTNGLSTELEESARAVLDRHGVTVEERTLVRLRGEAGRLEAAVFEEGERELDALFFHWGSRPAAALAPDAGCECSDAGDVVVNPRTFETTRPGIYAAGDLVQGPQLAIIAAAEGVNAALAIHRSLLPPEWEL